ncbi:MAG TPA: hypothetical protein PLY70_13245 [Saprospiraceae bacterium]|nr:hypothetical protein [Saprospiraceae bacterium]HPN68334.1 hypothetical protein [Saprospiraceae bacterium]
MIRKFIIFIGLVLVFSCTTNRFSGDIPTENETKIITILFVGNSLTYSNSLPDLVAKIGEQQGKKIKTLMLAYPNYALEDHWNEGKLQETIAKGSIDYLVMQQGPSSQEDG